MTEIEKLQWQVEALMNRVAALEAAQPKREFYSNPDAMPTHTRPLGSPPGNYPKDAFGRPLAY